MSACQSAYSYKNFPLNACQGQGFMPTRDLCILPQELPYQQRAFEPNLGGTNIPQMFCGGTQGYTKQVNIETDLRQISSRDPDGCNVYEFRDYGNMVPLLCEWQQPDFRPLYYTDHTRNMIKDLGRSPQNIYDQAHYNTAGGVNSYTPYYDPRSRTQPKRKSENACELTWVTKSVGV